jgi:hypothetical protein
LKAASARRATWCAEEIFQVIARWDIFDTKLKDMKVRIDGQLNFEAPVQIDSNGRKDQDHDLVA